MRFRSLFYRIAGSTAFALLTVVVNPTLGADDELALGVRTTEPFAPADQQTKFQLPPGFEIQLVAAEPDINKPLNLAFDATGRLWVTTSIEYPWAAPTNRPGRDRLMIFEDFGPDGRARKVTQFAEGLNIPIGIYPFRTSTGHWKAIVWSIPNIWLLEDTDGDGKADKQEALYGPFDYTRDTHGNQASFRRGFDGWLYATHGFNNDSHVTARDGSHVDLNSGNTYRIRLDGSRIEQHTHGQVNPFGLTWDSRGNLYSSDCHSAPIYQLLNGGWYPSFGKPHDGLGFAPVMLEHAHGSTAIDGACYYTDDLWPAEFQDTFFIGNVMTSRLNRDKITFIGSTPKATEQPDFLTSTDPWFRPVDTILGPDGALYIADFYNRIIGHYEVPLTHPGRDRERGRLWRVIYRGSDGAAKLRGAALPTDLTGLLVELGSANLSRRLLAMSEIQDRFGAPAVEQMRTSLKNPANHYQHIHALWLLHRLGGMRMEEFGKAAQASDALVRVHAQRIATDILYQAASGLPVPEDAVRMVRAEAVRGLTDPDALVQRCAADALGNFPHDSNVRPLLDLLARVPAGDTHLRYVARCALRDQLVDTDTFNAVWARTDWSDADQLAFADVALAVKTPESAVLLVRNLDRLGTAPDQLAPALAHAARYAPEEDLAKVVAYAKAKYPDNLNLKLDIFRWMQGGLDQRGITPAGPVRDWGAELAQQAYASIDTNSLAWRSAPIEGYNNMAPWKYEERRAVDGTTVRVLSSLPLRESFTAVLSSPIFRAPGQLSFWICGHDGPPDQPAQKKNLVRLRGVSDRQLSDTSKQAAPLAEAPPPRNDIAQKITWDLSAYEGQPVYFEVTDADAGNAYAWLAFGRFDPPVLTLPAVPPAEVTQRHEIAANLAAKLNLTSLTPRLRSVLDDPEAGLIDRVQSAKALAALEPEATALRLAELLADGNQPAAIRGDFGWALAEMNFDLAREALVAAMKSAPLRIQVRWAAELASTKAGAEALLEGVEKGQIPARVLQAPDVRNRLGSSNASGAQPRIEALTKDLPPADETREQLLAARRNAYAIANAKSAEGHRIYEVNCAVCHQLDGKGGLVGPQLTGIGNRGVERLCEDILDPNRNVDHAFRQSLITLKNGDVLSGLFRREDGELLVFADSTGKEFSLAKAEVAERREIDQSLMPDSFGEMPESDFNHLLAFLLAQRGK